MKKQLITAAAFLAGAATMIPLGVNATHGGVSARTTNQQARVESETADTQSQATEAEADHSTTTTAPPSDQGTGTSTSTTLGTSTNKENETEAKEAAEHQNKIVTGSSTTTPPITADQAQTIAKGQVAGSTITRVKLEGEHGSSVYEIRFANGSRVKINAADGSVIRVDIKK